MRLLTLLGLMRIGDHIAEIRLTTRENDDAFNALVDQAERAGANARTENENLRRENTKLRNEVAELKGQVIAARHADVDASKTRRMDGTVVEKRNGT